MTTERGGTKKGHLRSSTNYAADGHGRSHCQYRLPEKDFLKLYSRDLDPFNTISQEFQGKHWRPATDSASS